MAASQSNKSVKVTKPTQALRRKKRKPSVRNSSASSQVALPKKSMLTAVSQKNSMRARAGESRSRQGNRRATGKKQAKRRIPTYRRLMQQIGSLTTLAGWKQLGKRFLVWGKQKETIGLLLLCAAVLFFFYHFGTHQVDGRSMAPTFQTGDRILISKDQTPSRYAIVTFEPKDSPDSSYVKRIIGLPGDRIQVVGTALFLLPAESEATNGEPEDLSMMPDGAIKITVSEETAAQLAESPRIPEGHYFVQGDNRLHSDDSRVFGLVKASQIEGVVCYRYYPLNRVGLVQ